MKAPRWVTQGGTLSYDVPVNTEHYDPAEVDEWQTLMASWHADIVSESTARPGRFEKLARCGRLISFNAAHRTHGFAEALVALGMEARGFTCWTGVQLFPWDGRQVRAADRKRNTDEVEDLLRADGHLLPRDFLSRLEANPRMKNPDIVCRHRKHGTWRFIEVKRDESVLHAQVNALAFLHGLIGADVEIRRLIPRERKLPAPRTRAGHCLVAPL